MPLEPETDYTTCTDNNIKKHLIQHHDANN